MIFRAVSCAVRSRLPVVRRHAQAWPETTAAIPVVLIKLSEQPIPSLTPFGQWPSLALLESPVAPGSPSSPWLRPSSCSPRARGGHLHRRHAATIHRRPAGSIDCRSHSPIHSFSPLGDAGTSRPILAAQSLALPARRRHLGSGFGCGSSH
jgi:hypothetical protein